MVFPTNRIRFASSYQGRVEPEGWLVLDLAGVDLDGVNKLYLSASDLERIRRAGDTTSDRLKQARMLLGGSEDSENEETPPETL